MDSGFGERAACNLFLTTIDKNHNNNIIIIIINIYDKVVDYLLIFYFQDGFCHNYCIDRKLAALI